MSSPLRRFAKVTGTVPGPKAAALLSRRLQYVPRGVSYGIPTFIARAEGALLHDVDGNTFIDFAGAIGTMNVGHCAPPVVQALHEQVDAYIHPCFNVMMYEPYVELAEKLSHLAPGTHAKKVMFINSGAEAVENAVKIARRYTKRPAVIVFERGFHGRTLLTMSMTSKVKPYKFEFGPFASEVYKAPYPYPYRRPEGMSEEAYDEFVLNEFTNVILTGTVAPESVAAVVMEPVQGEGGFVIPSKRFVEGVAKVCAQHGILFVADEIQTGFCRTGKLFAIEHYGVIPDLISVSKSLGAGVPISGVIGRAEVMDAADPGQLGGTYAGCPLGCRAALAVLQMIEEENLDSRAAVIGDAVMTRFSHFMKSFPDVVGDVRGLGAMCAIEFVQGREGREPNKELAARLVTEAQHRGLILLSAGMYGNVVRVLMPLTISDEQLTEGLDIMEESLTAALKK